MTKVRQILVDVKQCRNCGKVQWPRLNEDGNTLQYSKFCQNKKCKSPYWDKARIYDKSTTEPKEKKKYTRGPYSTRPRPSPLFDIKNLGNLENLNNMAATIK